MNYEALLNDADAEGLNIKKCLRHFNSPTPQS